MQTNTCKTQFSAENILNRGTPSAWIKKYSIFLRPSFVFYFPQFSRKGGGSQAEENTTSFEFQTLMRGWLDADVQNKSRLRKSWTNQEERMPGSLWTNEISHVAGIREVNSRSSNLFT